MPIRERSIFICFRLSLLVGACSLTACSVIQRPIHLIYTNNKQSSKEAKEPTHEELVLATKLNKKLSFKINPQEDNMTLYAFVNDWIGTPYRFGRSSKKGTDCSGFVHNLLKTVYQSPLPRQSAASLHTRVKKLSREDELEEGDLVFFNIRNRRGGRASHVGIYLKDNKFVHASTSSGVIVSSLREPYYRRTYLGAGRLK